MKTTAMGHQIKGQQLLRDNREHFLLACEQGTGKTWMALADAEDQFTDGDIEALLVIAPKGVHTNWILREIPTHVSVPVRSAYYSAGASRKLKNNIEKLFRPPNGELIVLAINIDSINFAEGYALAARFLKHYKCIMAIDESSRIKSLKAARTKKAITLGHFAVSRRCLSGTPITNAPEDIFAQFEFLSPYKALLGTTSFRAFVAEYTELLPSNHHVMRHISTKINPKFTKMANAAAALRLRKELAAEGEAETTDDPVALRDREQRMKKLVAQELTPYLPQMPQKGENGRPILKNLDKLNGLLRPWMYRVLKKDCLDLPEKIYTTLYYDLSPKQQKIYDLANEELRFELGDEVDVFSPLTKQVKLQQIAAGFIMRDGVVTLLANASGGYDVEDETDAFLMPMDENPRMDLLKEKLEGVECQFIIWARFRQEIEQISDLLKSMDISFVEYHGGVKKAAREQAVDLFQSGAARCFLGNPQSGGIGLTLTKAEEVIYYSQSYNLEIRLQSEDRAHRIGTVTNVIYTDICAVGTIDVRIAEALQSKAHMAQSILDAKPEGYLPAPQKSLVFSEEDKKFDSEMAAGRDFDIHNFLMGKD